MCVYFIFRRYLFKSSCRGANPSQMIYVNISSDIGSTLYESEKDKLQDILNNDAESIIDHVDLDGNTIILLRDTYSNIKYIEKENLYLLLLLKLSGEG